MGNASWKARARRLPGALPALLPKGGPQLKHTIEKRDDDTAIVRVTGEVDAYSAPDLRAAFAELEQQEIHFIVADLTRVPFIDSTGLGVLNGVRKRAEDAGGKLVGVCRAANVRKVFETTGFLQLITLHETEAEALEDIGRAKEGGSDG